MKLSRLFDNFELLKRLLVDRAECKDNEIIIYDPPFEIRILKTERIIVVRENGEDVAVLGEEFSDVKNGLEDYIDEWITALTSLGFKRYLPRRKL